ncbi:hypothetical protein MIND_00104800 [Mycena indigotica]|uniref:Uncharacterized protein n=1 Tax=Mycena indigotica TaxID=2126181 RepID=A0A8H6TC86_9AGAR|nr:uncharacterized protein MIND_00104800 [Mycena indigotica]KAF7315883.1 hypothetical protein MIND_00104800 [Mycena indigotica]
MASGYSYRHPYGTDLGRKPPPSNAHSGNRYSHHSSQATNGQYGQIYAPLPPSDMPPSGYQYNTYPPAAPSHHYQNRDRQTPDAGLQHAPDPNNSTRSEAQNTDTSSPGPSQRRTMEVSVKFARNQHVQIRLNAASGWIPAVVVAVLELIGKKVGFQYQVNYTVGGAEATEYIPGNSRNIRAAPHMH